MSETALLLLQTGIRQCVSVLTDPNVRNYWMFIVSGAVLAVTIGRKDGFFRREAWLSVSARNDYVMWFANPVIHMFAYVALLVSFPFFGDIGTAMENMTSSVKASARQTGAWPWAVALALWLFVTTDFTRWLNHYLFHKIPALWELHKVHHSAEVLNFATAERFHPLELIISNALALATLWLANISFLILTDSAVGAAQILGANIFWVAANLAGGAFRHAPAWISYGPKLEKWFISPAMHQIHHSEAEQHWGKNLGSTLTIWDRLAGTWYSPDSHQTLRFGIGPQTSQYRSIAALYLLPLRNIFALTTKMLSTAPNAKNQAD